MLLGRVMNGQNKILSGVIEDGHIKPRDPLATVKNHESRVSLEDISWMTPCEPTQFTALWNNLHGAAMSNQWAIPAEPLYFLKSPSSFAAHDQIVILPVGVGRVVFEGELGIVIDRRCKDVNPEDASAYIRGFTCVNDLTAIEVVNRDVSFPQRTRAKGFDGFGVFGPVIATGLTWSDVTVRTLVNGRDRQNYPLTDLIFSPPQLVSYLSRNMTLMPDDIIACGTSLGSRPVKAGDVIEVIIDGIGTLRTLIADHAEAVRI